MIKNDKDTSHRSSPTFEPSEASAKALNGGYTVHPPLAGPVCTNKDVIITIEAEKKNQYDNIFRKGDAISLAPTCSGIKKFANVPLRPAVRTKKTKIVPCIVTS